MRGKALREKLRSGERVYGLNLEGFGQPRWPRFLADLNVIDYVWLDTEHAPNNRETVAWALQLYAAYDIAPLLRIPEPSPYAAAMGLDAGAHGIIVPYVETLQQVRALVGAVKYRPLKGQALQRALSGGGFPGPDVEKYLGDFNSEANLIIMIESPAGVQNLHDMLASGGVDAVFIGPHDLSISLGIPEQYDHPRFIDTVEQIIATCQQHKVGAGMHIITGSTDDAQRWIERGFNFVSVRGDTLYIAHGMLDEIATLRAHLDGTPHISATDMLGSSGHSI